MSHPRMTLPLLAAAGFMSLAIAAEGQYPTMGSIEHKDPRFDTLIPPNAKLEKLADKHAPRGLDLNQFEGVDGILSDAWADAGGNGGGVLHDGGRQDGRQGAVFQRLQVQAAVVVSAVADSPAPGMSHRPQPTMPVEEGHEQTRCG